jgi:AraC-like DNA-binding protein
VNGIETFVDPTVVYFERPADEQQIAHPGRGDACTVLYLSQALLASLCGGEPELPGDPVPTDAATDLTHRLLLAKLSHGDVGEAEESVVALAANVVEDWEPRRVESGRRATALARKRVVASAREALNEKPALGVIALARLVAVSPHHLSRVFGAATGETISRYRNRLRVRLALERIAEGEPCLARLAAELGFADQAHLSRVVRRDLETTPSDLRARLTVA